MSDWEDTITRILASDIAAAVEAENGGKRTEKPCGRREGDNVKLALAVMAQRQRDLRKTVRKHVIIINILLLTNLGAQVDVIDKALALLQ